MCYDGARLEGHGDLRRILLPRYFLAITFSLAGWIGGLQQHAGLTLDQVLRQLDDQARSFHGMTADVERTKVTVVVNDHSTECGQMIVHGYDMRIELKSPNARTILRRGDKLSIYNPKLNRVEEYDLGKHRTLVDQFLLLGFGTSGKSLQKAYEVTMAGESTRDGKRVVELDLTPRSAEVANQISTIQIWFDEGSWLPVQQKFIESGSGDYFEIHYSNAVRNATIPKDAFKDEWPKGTVKVRPQG
jgi:outer membrane lipoprotein-sorting protein